MSYGLLQKQKEVDPWWCQYANSAALFLVIIHGTIKLKSQGILG